MPRHRVYMNLLWDCIPKNCATFQERFFTLRRFVLVAFRDKLDDVRSHLFTNLLKVVNRFVAVRDEALS